MVIDGALHIRTVALESPAQRILVRPITAGRQLANDRDRRRFPAIPFIEIASLEQSRADGCEIIGTDNDLSRIIVFRLAAAADVPRWLSQ